MAQLCLSQTSCLRIAGNLAEYEKIYISYASRSEKSLRLYAKFIKENVRKTWGAKIIVCGRLDTQTAPELEKEIDGIIANLKDLVFDMTGLEYVSSAGLRVILKAQKIMNAQGSMKLTGVNDSIMEVVDITGFLDILTIE